MRICLIGHFNQYIDEGVKNLTSTLRKELSISHKVLCVEINKVHINIWNIKKFSPEIIHLVVGPSSILGFFVSKILSLFINNSKIVMSAPQPSHFYLENLIPLLKPNMVLIQSKESDFFFKKMGCETDYFPNFIDSVKFSPVSNDQKIKLRTKYGLSLEKFIILHVGHIKSLRNISTLKKFQRDNNQVIIVGSTSTNTEESILQELQNSGCIVWTEYFESIEEIYNLSDCYIFPTLDESSCIEIPLSVLEAMSCNLPVICTKFRALPTIFSEGNGFMFINSLGDIFNCLETIKNGSLSINTRSKVLPYSKSRLTNSLEKIYINLLSSS